MTKDAFENAIAVTMALGGSTNAVLHLLAIANEAGVELTLDDFDRIGRRTPHIADMKPHGRYHMVDLDRIGGVPVVMRALLERGLLHGDCLTVTGRTIAENLEALQPAAPDGRVVHPVGAPLHEDGGIAILTGSLAPRGCRGQGRRHRPGPLRGHRPGVRRRGRRHGGHSGRLHRARHRAGDSLRGAQGWARHPRDAGGDRGHEGRRPRGRLCPHDRRPIQRRHPRFLRGPHCARSASSAGPSRWWPTAIASWWTSPLAASSCVSTRPSSNDAAPSGSRRSRATRVGCWRSSPGW